MTYSAADDPVLSRQFHQSTPETNDPGPLGWRRVGAELGHGMVVWIGAGFLYGITRYALTRYLPFESSETTASVIASGVALLVAGTLVPVMVTSAGESYGGRGHVAWTAVGSVLGAVPGAVFSIQALMNPAAADDDDLIGLAILAVGHIAGAVLFYELSHYLTSPADTSSTATNTATNTANVVPLLRFGATF
ncbi:MAG: hypothetical protein ACNA8W_15530 [Bradymonadaceae bacterium]